jgi:hypothetical protein
MGNRVYSSTGGLLRKKKRNPLASEQNADGYEYGDLNA